MTDFAAFNAKEAVSIDEKTKSVQMYHTDGDHFVVYSGLKHRVNSFTLEADVDFDSEEAIKSAALIFGFPFAESANMHWYGANVDSTRVGRADAFRVFGPGVETRDGGEIGDIDLSRTVHLALDVHSDGAFSYRFGNSVALHGEYRMQRPHEYIRLFGLWRR